MGAFEVGDRNTRGDAEGPGVEDSGLAQEPELAENLDCSLLENIVDEIGAGQAGNVAAQQRVAVSEELFQGSPVAGLGEEDEKGLVGGGRLLRM